MYCAVYSKFWTWKQSLKRLLCLKKRYSLSITSCIIWIFFKYIHKIIKKLRNSIRQFSIWLCWNFWNKKANLVLIGTWACILWNFLMVRELGTKIFVVHMYLKVESSLHVTFAKLAQICLTSRTLILTICIDHQVWPFLWPWILTQILTLTLCFFNLKKRRYIWSKNISQILIPFITKICVLIWHHAPCNLASGTVEIGFLWWPLRAHVG